MKAWVRPTGSAAGDAGVTVIEVRMPPDTVTAAVPVIVPLVAVIVTGPPVDTPVTTPPATEATAALEVVQPTVVVIGFVLPSE